jgi:hypothetical protein
VVSGWQESNLCNSDHSLVSCAPGDTPATNSGGTIGCERGQSYQGPPELFTTDGGVPGGTGTGGVEEETPEEGSTQEAPMT